MSSLYVIQIHFNRQPHLNWWRIKANYVSFVPRLLPLCNNGSFGAVFMTSFKVVILGDEQHLKRRRRIRCTGPLCLILIGCMILLSPIPRYYKGFCINSFFLCGARLWNSLSVNVFLWLMISMAGVSRHLYFGLFLISFPICFSSFCSSFF